MKDKASSGRNRLQLMNDVGLYKSKRYETVIREAEYRISWKRVYNEPVDWQKTERKIHECNNELSHVCEYSLVTICSVLCTGMVHLLYDKLWKLDIIAFSSYSGSYLLSSVVVASA